MFYKLRKAYEELDLIAQNAVETWKVAEAQIDEEYGHYNLKAANEKRAEVKEKFEATVESAKKDALQVVEEVFENMDKKTKEKVLVPVPNDYVATLEAIKIAGKDLTRKEADLYLEKFKGNYTAYRSLVNHFKTVCGFEINDIQYYDAMIDGVEEYHREITYLFNNYSVQASNLGLSLAFSEGGEFAMFVKRLEEYLAG